MSYLVKVVVDQLVNQGENKIQLSSNLAIHTNYRFIKNINMKTKICRKTLQWLLFRKDLRTQTRVTMKKRVKFYFIKIKNSYSWNVTNTRQTQGMPVTDWGLAHRLYENHLQISSKKNKISWKCVKVYFDRRNKPQTQKYYRKVINCSKYLTW